MRAICSNLAMFRSEDTNNRLRSLHEPAATSSANNGSDGSAGASQAHRSAQARRPPLDPERYTGAAFDLRPMSAYEDATDFLKLYGSARQPALSVRWGDFGKGERRCITRWRWHFVISKRPLHNDFGFL